MKIILLYTTILITFALGCTKKENSEFLSNIKTKKVLRVGTTGDYKPFTYKSISGDTYSGIDIDLMNLLSGQLGVKLEIVDTTWPSLMNDFKAKKFDIALSGITQTSQRELIADFSNPYHMGGKVPFGRCKDLERFKDIKNLDQKNVKFIVNPGGTNEKFTRKLIKKAKIILHTDNKTVFDEILEGNADIMISDSIEVDILTQIHKGKICRFKDQPFKESMHNIAIMIPKEIGVKEFINEWISNLKNSGKLKEIFDKHLTIPQQ